MKAYKGFNKDMTCRDFQFEEGKTYEYDGEVKLCESGFHACEDPLDIFEYYDPANSEFHEVELDGVSNERRDDTKVASKKITIGTQLNIDQIIKTSLEFRFSKFKKELKNSDSSGIAINSNYKGAMFNSFNYGITSTLGNKSVSYNSGYRGAALNIGSGGAASNSGTCGIASNSGRCGIASNSGDYGAASNSGDYGVAFNLSYKGIAYNLGYEGLASNSGNKGVASNLGNRGAALNSGYSGVALNISDYGLAETFGKNSIAVSVGYHSIARGALGTWLVLTECDALNDESYLIKDVKTFKVDGEQVKADTWYMLVNGKLTQV